eukprot:CAMPEP_0181330102 /NCGR_PEP_ID=MMETSP1101-20121128/23702_1 /TAXON_ID=46948 /ORGANISM="Rhodomonas abbreviata, Strain Caron Lab Isolate" /LENGTH=40 /DNA_ID= /DNA_START= /DNA_END= /DNA_ORIENTATION=
MTTPANPCAFQRAIRATNAIRGRPFASVNAPFARQTSFFA